MYKYNTHTTSPLIKTSPPVCAAHYKVYTKIVDDYMKANNITDDNDLPEWFVTAQTLNYKDRVNMQAVWQSHIDASISSTVNVPNDFTKEQTYDLYMLAHDKGLKGITIFRDGCKRTGILNISNANNMEPLKEPEQLSRGVIIEANDNASCDECYRAYDRRQSLEYNESCSNACERRDEFIGMFLQKNSDAAEDPL